MLRIGRTTLDSLPAPVNGYLAAHRAHDTSAQLALFTADATVRDDGSTYEGADAISEWLNRAAAEYTYTITPTAAEQTEAGHCTVTQHLEGDFPGGTVDLRFRFTLHGDLIAQLVIEP